jgi:AcrR family transcriptional regulator
MTPRSDVSEERRDQILDAASEVFVERGFHKARMEDIAKRSKLSKGSLYWYFKSKDAIVNELFNRIFSREAQEIERLISHQGSSTDRLLAYTERIVKDVNRFTKFAPIAYEFLSLAARSKFFQEALRKYLKEHLGILIPIIQQGIDSGEFINIDPEDAAIAFGAIFEGTLALWVYDTELVDPVKHIRIGIHYLLRGFQAS